MKRGFIIGFAAATATWIAIILLPILMPQTVSRTLFSFLDVSEPPRRVDYLLVPSGSLFYRLPFAVGLLNQRMADTIVLTVTEPPKWRKEAKKYSDDDFTEGSLVLRLLRSHGICDTQVVFLGQSRSTWQDARLFTHFMSAHPAAAAAAVSDGYHLRRLRLSFDRSDEPGAKHVFYIASSTFDDLLRRDTEYSDAYQQVFKEWIKLAFYYLGRA
jgi:uncharacterized SAM-binding protein YcdF (DUF218 family)